MRKEQFLQLVEEAKSGSNPIISDKSFEGFTLSKMDLSRITFNACRFDSVDFDNCKFKLTDLRNSTLLMCSFDGCNFEGAHLEGTVWQRCDGSLVTFDGCNFDHGKWNVVKMNERHFDHGKWNVVYWMGCELQGLQMEGVRLMQSVMQSSDLVGAVMKDCEFEQNRFMQSKVSNARFISVMFHDTSLDRVLGGSIPNTEFVGCYFGSSDFSGMELDGIRFHRCNFR